MLLLGLNFGGITFPWDSPKVICLIVFGALMSILFVFSEKKLTKHPLIPLYLLGDRSNATSLLVRFVHGFVRERLHHDEQAAADFDQVFIAGEYYMPLYFQSVMEASPMRSGVLILPFILPETFMGITCGLVIHKTGRYLELMWAGMALLTIGFGLFIHLNAYSPLVQVAAFQIVGGLGSGLLFEPPLIALQANTLQKDVASATSTSGLVLNLAMSISIVAGGVLFQNGMKSRDPTLRGIGLSDDLIQQFTNGDAAANVMTIGSVTDPAQRFAVKRAFAWSLRNLWIMYTCIASLGLLASIFVQKRKLSKEHVETKTGIVVGGDVAIRPPG